jgi:OOP family OmpA-OmpF porin
MFVLKGKKIVATVAPLAVAMGMIMGSTAVMAKNPNSYAQDKSNSVVVDNYGECWKAKGTERMEEACGDMMVEVVDGDDDNDGVLNSMDKCPNTRPGATVDADGCEIIENLTIDLVEGEFDFDSAVLKPGMESALTDLADKIKASAGHETLSIVGHTDSIGSEDYNQGLSEQRAQSAADFLGSQGIDNISTSGMGETQPVADNGTNEGRSQNRRVEVKTH